MTKTPRKTWTNPEAGRPLSEALGESEAFLAFQEQLSRAAQVDRPVLILGERGTGKELAATRLHYLSKRWNEPFVALNCAALAAALIETELFGHEAGAFTGAAQRRIGRFEAADKGTLFLDEIGNIPLEVQTKILRVVEYQSFERVGGAAPIRVDARIIGATNANLPDLTREGRFQRDLLDRLSFEVLHLPPLRERTGDISLLANYFAARMAREVGRDGLPLFTDAALSALETYSWPGNIRELKNVVERAVYRSDSDLIENIVFDPFPRSPAPPPMEMESDRNGAVKNGCPDPEPDLTLPLEMQVAALEKRLLRKALSASQYHQKKAASLLGLTYHQFRGLYRKHGFKE